MISELRLAIYAGVLIAIAVFLLWVHHEGAAACERNDQSAALADAAHTHQIDQDTINDLKSQLAANVAPTEPTGQPPPRIRVCVPAGLMPARGAAPSAQSGAGTLQGSDRGVPSGVATEVDAGPSMQDFALTSLFYLSDSQELWARDVRQATPAR